MGYNTQGKGMNLPTSQGRQSFEEIKQSTDGGGEFWYARELQGVLGYAEWRNFTFVIEKARTACTKAGQSAADHFVEINKMIEAGKGATRGIDDLMLSRYACYLIVQNADPSKDVIAAGQTYFAVQARRQEISDESRFEELTEADRRLMLRAELSHHNKGLVAAAKKAGVETGYDFAIFQDHGYKGLYGGMTAKDIHRAKGLKPSHKILDNMGSTELAANLFRATQAEEKIKRDKISGKIQANNAHFEVGRKVRKTIQDLGGTMPENLPSPEKSIPQLEREKAKRLKKED